MEQELGVSYSVSIFYIVFITAIQCKYDYC